MFAAQRMIVHGKVVGWSKLYTQDGDFKSIVAIPASGTTPAGDDWTEDQVWAVAERTFNSVTYTTIEMFTPVEWSTTDNDYCWFVDGGISGASTGVAEIPATEVAATYTMTLISENGSIWGIPVGDGAMLAGLDSDVAVDLGGGLVGLPYLGHPFTAGETVRITNTTNYNGSEVLHATTDPNQLVVTSAYNAETFDGTEIIVKHIASLTSGSGRMAQDSVGNLYYAHNRIGTVPNRYHVTKIETDGTISPDYEWLTIAWSSSNSDIRGIEITPDDAYMYLFMNVVGVTDYGYILKFDLVTGDLVWSTAAISGVSSSPGYDMAIDANSNAYAIGDSGKNVFKGASADGAMTEIDLYRFDSGVLGGYQYEVEVDDSQSKVVLAGRQWDLTSQPAANLFNMIIMDLDGGNQVPVQVGGTYDSAPLRYTPVIGTGMIAIHGSYIYVLTAKDGTTWTLFKYDFDGNEITTVATDTYAVGLYVDLYDNIVVVAQDWITGQDDVLWFYDTDLTYLSKIEGMYTLMLQTWDAAAGGSWIQGNAVFDGALAIPGDPIVYGTDPNYVAVDPWPADVNMCVYADGNSIGTYTTEADANGTIVLNLGAEYDVVIAGFNYWSKLETMPLIVPDYPRTASDPIRISDKKIDRIKVDMHRSTYLQYGMGPDSPMMTADYNEVTTSWIDLEDFAMTYGSKKKATVYMQVFEPTPLGVRSIISDVTAYDPN